MSGAAVEYAGFQLPTDVSAWLPVGEMPGLPEWVPGRQISAADFGLSESESHFAIDEGSKRLRPSRAGIIALADSYRSQAGTAPVEGTWHLDSDDEYPV